MGLSLTVEGAKVNFQLSDYEIRGYEFDYHATHSKYAKGFEDVRSLRIIGDISRIIEKNREILELIRRWAKQEYTDDSYYNSVKATYTYSEDLVREIVFPDAFIKEYKETINPHTGHGTFSILFLQKFSKRTAVEIEPFDNFSNESANSLAESQKILVASLDNNLARLAPEYHGLGGAALRLNFERPERPLPLDSTTYSGEVGVAWVRDTTASGSPLTVGELISDTYTLEVDYLTWDTAAAILAASADYDIYKDIVEQLAVCATGTALAAYICPVLGIPAGTVTTIASVAVGAAVGVGWNWLKSMDRDNMYNCFVNMNTSKDQYMKVQFMWSSNIINRLYSIVPKTDVILSPFPGTYCNWHNDTYGYLYSY